MPSIPIIPALPFWLHFFVELPPSVVFLVKPDAQLAAPQPHARPLIRQYAALLFSMNLTALIFAWREVDETSQLVAGAMAIYHIAPIIRALHRFRHGENTMLRSQRRSHALGGPGLHLLVHSICLLSLAHLCWSDRWSATLEASYR